MYQQVGGVDGVVGIAAHGALDDFASLTVDALHDNMRAKFYGQADLVLTGQHHCNNGASFTLTSGVFADQPWPGVTGGGVISGALHGFVSSAAIELPRGMRINVVSPTKIEDRSTSSTTNSLACAQCRWTNSSSTTCTAFKATTPAASSAPTGDGDEEH